MKLKYLFFLFSIFFFGSIYSQLSRKHFIPPLTSSDDFTDQYLFISTPKNNNVSYKVTAVGNNQNFRDYEGIVSNSQPKIISILDNNRVPASRDSHLHIPISNISGVINNKGFIIEASDAVYVSIRVRSSFQGNSQRFHAGALVSKGSSALGNKFRIGGFVRNILHHVFRSD